MIIHVWNSDSGNRKATKSIKLDVNTLDQHKAQGGAREQHFLYIMLMFVRAQFNNVPGSKYE